MATPLENYNYDNILVRNVIAGLLSILNNSISYTQTWDNNTIETVNVPWLYDLGSSDERMMQDNYTHFGPSCLPKKIDGNFDIFPRGSIRLESSKIDSDNICNRFVQGLTTKLENGKVTTYHSYLYAIPLTLTFNCEIWCDNFSNMLKIEQSLREQLYRNKTFYVLFKGMKIGCCMGMPDDYNQQKNTEYSLQTETGEQKIKLTFTILVETYHPVFDDSMEVPNEKRMKGIAFDVNFNNSSSNKDITIYCPDVIINGIETHLSWDYKNQNSDVCTVNIEYRKIKNSKGEYIEGELKPIAMGLENQKDFYYTFNEKSGIDIDIFINDENVEILKSPIIKIISNDNIIVTDPGYFIFSSDDGLYDVNIDIGFNYNGKYKTIKNFGTLHLIWSKINMQHPIDINNQLNVPIDLSEYEIIITDGVNSDVKDVKSGIKII